MKCEDVSNELILYLDGKSKLADRQEIEHHLASCTACQAKAEEFRKVWATLDELPAIEPSFGFDARVRHQIAAEPQRKWFGWFVPQPRLAFSAALLVALCVWLAKMPANHIGTTGTPTLQQGDFSAIQNLGVLENYDVVTKMDALSQLVSDTGDQPSGTDQSHPDARDNGGV
jgi:predicted anti-sigma-YlaC factor YlaD